MMTIERTKVELAVSVSVDPGGEDDPFEIPAEVDLEADTVWVYVRADEISKHIQDLLNAPGGVSDFGLALRGLLLSQHYRLAWQSARRRALRLRDALPAVRPRRVTLSDAERRRIAKAERAGFDALVHAVEDVITERLGGIPNFPTPDRGSQA